MIEENCIIMRTKITHYKAHYIYAMDQNRFKLDDMSPKSYVCLVHIYKARYFFQSSFMCFIKLYISFIMHNVIDRI